VSNSLRIARGCQAIRRQSYPHIGHPDSPQGLVRLAPVGVDRPLSMTRSQATVVFAPDVAPATLRRPLCISHRPREGRSVARSAGDDGAAGGKRPIVEGSIQRPGTALLVLARVYEQWVAHGAARHLH
jgi:hypothetical protein